MNVYEGEEGVPEWAMDDEEERAAEALEEDVGPPTFRVLLPRTKTKSLFVMICPSSHLLSHHALENKRKMGSMLCTSVSLVGSHLRPHPQDRTCFVYSLGDPSECLLVMCQARYGIVETNMFPVELFRKIEAERVIVVDSLVGPLIERHFTTVEEVPDCFLLRTKMNRRNRIRSEGSLPLLPTGILVEGLVASILTHCEGMSWDAMAILMRQPLPLPEYGQILGLARILSSMGVPAFSGCLTSCASSRNGIEDDLERMWKDSSFGKVYM